jgi:DNA modification methylase
MIAEGVKVNCIVTSPPYWGLREYGVAGQFGLESSWQRHVARMRGVFRLARELLADDGTLWLNYGDCYAGAPGGRQGKNGQRASRTFTARIDHHKKGHVRDGKSKQSSNLGSDFRGAPHRRRHPDLKPKDLVGMPWRVALALQDNGWWLRSDIIWHKPNVMPENITDRPTKAHEYIFLLAKSPRYHYDCDAISEPTSDASHPRKRADQFGGNRHDHGIGHSPGSVYTGSRKNGVNPKAGMRAGTDRESGKSKQNPSFSEAVCDLVPTRNARSVWTIPTQPFSGAHFATFPEELVARCILAGSRVGDIVFDPFHGSGTTGSVALSLGRRYIGLELNPEYIKMAQSLRSSQLGMGL